jgi:hypothetical protein
MFWGFSVMGAKFLALRQYFKAAFAQAVRIFACLLSEKTN